MGDAKFDTISHIFGQAVRNFHYRIRMLLDGLGVYPGQPPFLCLLWEKDGRSQKEFVEELRLKPSTVTIMLKRMEKAGLLLRKTDLHDLRISRVYLTEKGKKVRSQVEKSLRTVEKECFQGFTPEEAILLRRLLIHLNNNLIRACENCNGEKKVYQEY